MKTAEQLQITPQELTALLTVRDGLASGKYRHVEYDNFGTAGDGDPVFSMHTAYTNYSCGQVGCIGGWTAIAMGIPESEADDYVYNKEGYYNEDSETDIPDAPPIYSLFFPDNSKYDYDSVTPAIAVAAIDNFVESGDPKWSTLLKEAA